MKKRKVEKRLAAMRDTVAEALVELRAAVASARSDLRSVQLRVSELEKLMHWPVNNKWPTK